MVVGQQRDAIAAALDSIAVPGARIRLVEQEQVLGSAHALARVRPLVRGPFVVLLGDYFFRLSDPLRVRERLRAGQGFIAAKREPDRRLVSEACALEVDAAGRLLGIVEKPADPGERLKGCGIYGWPGDFFDALGRTPRTALRDEYEITVSIELYISAGGAVFAEELVVWDANLTRPEDLLICNLHWLAEHGHHNLVAPDARVERTATLDSTLVGPGAVVGGHVRLTDVVVFAGARVEPGVSLARALVTPQGIVACEPINSGA